MDSFDNSTDRKPRSVSELYDRLEEILEQLPKDRQKVMKGILHAGTLAQDLKKAIVESGRTTYDIGKSCGVNPGMIDRFVSGQRDMRIATASKICEALGYGLAKIETAKPAKKAAVKSPTKKAVKKKKPPA